MRRCLTAILVGLIAVAGPGGELHAQTALTWEQVRARFEAANPTLRAAALGVDESRANEVTAGLKPNPVLSAGLDQIDPFPGGPAHGTFSYLFPLVSANYLLERDHKRDLRVQSAQEATRIAVAGQSDLTRTLEFDLRGAFVQTLQEKAILALAQDNLAYYDRVLAVNRNRFAAGDIAQVDLDRLELQRAQYESDLQAAEVNLRTAKIQLLALLNDRTPVSQFDIAGEFDFAQPIPSLDVLRQQALDTRPDLQAALEAVTQAQTDHRLAAANGSTDPTLGLDVGRDPPIDAYFGFSVSVPLRIHDRNQGEKARTAIEVDRSQQLAEALRSQVFSDVDSAYAALLGSVALLQPYKDQYLQQALRVRDTVSFSYQQGATSLLDFLDAQADYRGIQVSYLNLVAACLNAANQLNLAVGREVVP